VAIAARLSIGALLLSAGPAQFVLASDDGDAYDAVARAQALGAPIVMTDRLVGKWPDAGEVAARWPQGYTWFLAAQYRLFGSAYVSTIVLQALLGAGGVLAGFALASRLLPESAARLAGVGQALSSTGVYLSAGLFAESVYVPLLLGGLALLVRRESGRGSMWLWPALAGGLFGLAEVTRPLGLAVFATALLWTIWQRRRQAAFALCLGFAAAVAPFAIHDLVASGRLLLLTAGGADALRDGAAQSQNLGERALTLFVTGGWAPLGDPIVAGWVGLTLLSRLAEWGFALAGVMWLLAPARRTPEAWLLVAAALAVVGPALLLGLPLVRYRAPADPLFVICMVAGVLGACRAAWSAASLRRGLAG
jgi:4-amino-4-deoxy-L-arabinose transferase-like glycosyltransferase